MEYDRKPLQLSGRLPTALQAYLLFFLACAGRLFAGTISRTICYVLSYFVYNISAEFVSELTGLIYYAGFIILPIVLCARRTEGVMYDYMRIKPLSGRLSLLCVLAGIAGVMFVTWLSYLWLIPIQELGGHLTGGDMTVPDTAGGMMMAILTGAALPGICEEMLFRGALLGACEVHGSKKAMFIVGFAFMALHGSIEGMPSEFISGLVLAFIVISTDSLFAGMIYHTVHNAAILLISYSAGQADDAAAVTILEGIGGAGGLVSVVFYCVLFGTMLVYILSRIDRARRDRNFGVPATPAPEHGWQELLALGCCAVVVLMFYTEDILYLIGILQ